jgi:epoxyqueuosine reductase QueG
MARLAGFGNYGKNALIITPKYGPWIRLGAIITDAEFVYDEPFDNDLCGDCEKCIKACPTGALTPYKVDHTRCLVNPSGDDWARLISGELKYSEKHGKISNIDTIFDLHSPRLTENSILMCTTCQKACPYGRKERGLEPLKVS